MFAGSALACLLARPALALAADPRLGPARPSAAPGWWPRHSGAPGTRGSAALPPMPCPISIPMCALPMAPRKWWRAACACSPPARYRPDAVTIHVLQGGMAREIVDTHGLFGGDEAADVAGFRVMNADGGSDWLAFLGASYFRASGPTGQYGLSAARHRGGHGAAGAGGISRLHRFLDRGAWRGSAGDPRAGRWPVAVRAYTIDTTRNAKAMVQEVEATLFLRRDIAAGAGAHHQHVRFDEGQRADRATGAPSA
jgi:glucans biosynthesis protein